MGRSSALKDCGEMSGAGSEPGAVDGWSGRPRSMTSSGGAVGSVASRDSDVKVGTSGK